METARMIALLIYKLGTYRSSARVCQLHWTITQSAHSGIVLIQWYGHIRPATGVLNLRLFVHPKTKRTLQKEREMANHRDTDNLLWD